MKSIIFKSLLYFFFLGSVLLFVFFLSGYLSRNHRLGTTTIKHDRLKTIKQRKIVLLGGSNLHYGINSALLEDSLGIPVVNMGIQGSLGLKYYFAEIIDQINKGDIVLVLLEPYNFCQENIDGEQTLYNLISKYPEGIKYLTFKQCRNSVYHLGTAIQENLEYLITLLALKSINKPTIYELTNSWGDYIGHKNKSSVYDPKMDKPLYYKVSDKAISFLEYSKQRIEAKKAHLFVGFAPTANSVANKAAFEGINDAVYQTFHPFQLGELNSYIFPDSFFYNTSHHLLYDYRDMRTKMVLEDIRKNKTAAEIILNNSVNN